MDRDATLKELADLESRYKVFPRTTGIDIDDFLRSEERKLDAMTDTDLAAERDAALARIQEREQQKRRDELVREVSSRRLNWLMAHRATLTRQLQANMPPELIAAIDRMKKQVEVRAEYGIAEVSFSQTPGGALHRSAKGRTPADERATARSQKAVEKLEALAFVTDAEVSDGIREVLKWLANADAADLPAVHRVERPAPIAQIRDAVGNYIAAGDAEIVPSGNSASRERLYPAG